MPPGERWRPACDSLYLILSLLLAGVEALLSIEPGLNQPSIAAGLGAVVATHRVELALRGLLLRLDLTTWRADYKLRGHRTAELRWDWVELAFVHYRSSLGWTNLRWHRPLSYQLAASDDELEHRLQQCRSRRLV